MPGGSRTQFERDHDRILFGAPVRRLADKTQVFPLEKHDAVRTRLTHSLEVSNIARSIGVDLAFNRKLFPREVVPERNVPAVLGAIGLAHDLGNPPFGHEGEKSIQRWFAKHEAEVFDGASGLTPAMRQDFLKFEGNAQTLRLLTRLQVTNDEVGLNLTYGTLASLMKYTVASEASDKEAKEEPQKRKPGFFQSEQSIVAKIRTETGLVGIARHPFAYVLEAADDVAYSVIDAEDAVKKGLVSFTDVIAYLDHKAPGDPLTKRVIDRAGKDYGEFRKARLSPDELDDIAMQKFRVYALNEMVEAVTKSFADSFKPICEGSFKGELLQSSEAGKICDTLKDFDRMFAYQHMTVRRIELQGYNVLTNLMDILWGAITDRKTPTDLASDKKAPFSNYVYSKISENYRRILEDPSNSLPTRYKELQLVTDMISGMTDSFGLRLHRELRALRA